MILHDFAFFGWYTLHITHHFSCFFEPVTIVLVLCMIFMILHDHISWFCIFWELYPYISYIIFHNFLSQWWYSCAWFAWFCMTIFHAFAWFSNCWDVHPHVSHIIFHDFLSQLLCWYSCAFSSWRLHLSSYSVIGSLEDRNVLMTIQDNYFNTVCYFEQVL